jgi:hypothetical protein
MIVHDTDPQMPSSVAGTLNDYTESLYRHFFEVSDASGAARSVFLKYLGGKHTGRLHRLENGYELDIPIQCAPELVQLLTRDSIAVYQVVRLAKVEGRW